MADARDDFETRVPARIAAISEEAAQVGATIVFRVTGEGGGVWSVRLKDGPGVTVGDTEGAECVLEMSNEDWRVVSDDPKSALKLYFAQKIRVTGNPIYGMQIQNLLADG